VQVDIRAPAAGELDAVFAVRAQAFAVPDTDRARWTTETDPDGLLAAFADGEIVGALRVLPFAQWFGGRSVPCAGLASVVVRPEHRGKGVAPQLLGAAVERSRDRGLAVATLHPATVRLYRRCGWEIGGDFAVRTVEGRSLESLPPGDADRIRRIDRTEALLLRACYDRAASASAGWLDRPASWWERVEADAFRDQHYVYAVDGDGDDLAGYVVFRQRQRDDWGFSLTVDELVAPEPAALATLARFLGGHAMQARTVTFVGGALDELLLHLPEQDVREVSNNRWMVRVLDAPAAVAARGFPPALRAEVHLDLRDPVARWHEGRHVLRVEGGRGELLPGGSGDAQLSANGLGALFSGWASAESLHRAGLLHHAAPEARRALSAMFAGPRPTIADDF
jgi:predicted acetyltransferase